MADPQEPIFHSNIVLKQVKGRSINTSLRLHMVEQVEVGDIYDGSGHGQETVVTQYKVIQVATAKMFRVVRGQLELKRVA